MDSIGLVDPYASAYDSDNEDRPKKSRAAVFDDEGFEVVKKA